RFEIADQNKWIVPRRDCLWSPPIVEQFAKISHNEQLHLPSAAFAKVHRPAAREHLHLRGGWIMLSPNTQSLRRYSLFERAPFPLCFPHQNNQGLTPELFGNEKALHPRDLFREGRFRRQCAPSRPHNSSRDQTRNIFLRPPENGRSRHPVGVS